MPAEPPGLEKHACRGASDSDRDIPFVGSAGRDDAAGRDDGQQKEAEAREDQETTQSSHTSRNLVLVGLVEVDALLLAELMHRHAGSGQHEKHGDQQIETANARGTREAPIETDAQPAERRT